MYIIRVVYIFNFYCYIVNILVIIYMMNCDLFCIISFDFFYLESGVIIYQSVFFFKEKVSNFRKILRKGKMRSIRIFVYIIKVIKLEGNIIE